MKETAVKKRLIPLIIIAAAAALAASLYLFGFWKNGGHEAIVVSGNIELTEVNVSFKIPGKLVERAVDEGEPVKKGMVVARLDREQLLSQRERARAAMASAESRLAQVRTGIEYQTENIAGQVEQRQAELRQAEAVLQELQAGSRKQEIEQARAAVYGAQTAYEKAKKDFERAQQLFRKEDISASEFDRFRSVFEGSEASLRQARERLALVVEGPRKEDIEAARAQVARARAAVRVAEAGRIDLKRMHQETATRQAEIGQVRAETAVIESQLADTVAISPIDGTVLVKSAEPGEVVAAGTTVLTVGDLDRPWLRAYINETDLGRVRLGDETRVTTDSFPGKVYRGRVSFISSEAEFTPKQIQTKEERVKLVYRIKIDVENPNHELKSNMPADAEILAAGARK
jgi:HlyD family secretion protein